MQQAQMSQGKCKFSLCGKFPRAGAHRILRAADPKHDVSMGCARRFATLRQRPKGWMDSITLKGTDCKLWPTNLLVTTRQWCAKNTSHYFPSVLGAKQVHVGPGVLLAWMAILGFESMSQCRIENPTNLRVPSAILGQSKWRGALVPRVKFILCIGKLPG